MNAFKYKCEILGSQPARSRTGFMERGPLKQLLLNQRKSVDLFYVGRANVQMLPVVQITVWWYIFPDLSSSTLVSILKFSFKATKIFYFQD